MERIAKIEQNEAKKGNSERSEIDAEKSDTSSHKTDFLTRTNSRRQEGEGVVSETSVRCKNRQTNSRHRPTYCELFLQLESHRTCTIPPLLAFVVVNYTYSSLSA